MMGSPGSGLQQLPKRTAMPGSPCTMMPLTGTGFGLRLGRLRGGRGRRAAPPAPRPWPPCDSWSAELVQHLRRADMPPKPTAAYRSSSRGHVQALEHVGREFSGFRSDGASGWPWRLRRILQHLAAALDVLLAVFPLEPLADAVARGLRLDDLEPVAAGARLAVGRDDLDHVVRLELVIQPHEVAVHARALAMVADVGMDAVGKVERCGPLGQVENLAARRKHKHVFAKEVL